MPLDDLFYKPGTNVIERGAILSPCTSYRYVLWRKWGPGNVCNFIGLNPSTADAMNDDPTIRRCISFAKSWGYDGLVMTNLFAWRATDPRDMKVVANPVGPENNHTLLRVWADASISVAAWGTHGNFRNRSDQVRKLLPRLHFLRLTKDWHPAHPLYLPGHLKPKPWWERNT